MKILIKIWLYFDRINELDIFNYLINEDKNDYYENKTLYDLMKTNIVDNFMKEINKLLLIYPECDLLYDIKSLLIIFIIKQLLEKMIV